MRHHRNAASANVNRPLYQHMHLHHQDFTVFKITVIDQETNLRLRKQKEREYIFQLKTKLPFGLNTLQ